MIYDRQNVFKALVPKFKFQDLFFPVCLDSAIAGNYIYNTNIAMHLYSCPLPLVDLFLTQYGEGRLLNVYMLYLTNYAEL